MNHKIETILITARPGLALAAEKAGVSFAMVDLEINGKSERQPAGTTPIYRHTWDDVAKVRQVLRGTTKLLVRVNPPHGGSRDEVEKALDLGADALMLPYFKTVKEIETFRSIVNGRVKTLFLFESSQAVAFAPMILDACVGEDVHFGLNDLMLSMGTRSPFDALAGGMIEWLAKTAEEKKLFFGIGGVGRVGGANDKVPAELVLGEHVRLRSKRVILSRSFVGKDPEAAEQDDTITRELAKIHATIESLQKRNVEETENSRRRFVDVVQSAVW